MLRQRQVRDQTNANRILIARAHTTYTTIKLKISWRIMKNEDIPSLSKRRFANTITTNGGTRVQDNWHTSAEQAYFAIVFGARTSAAKFRRFRERSVLHITGSRLTSDREIWFEQLSPLSVCHHPAFPDTRWSFGQPPQINRGEYSSAWSAKCQKLRFIPLNLSLHALRHELASSSVYTPWIECNALSFNPRQLGLTSVKALFSIQTFNGTESNQKIKSKIKNRIKLKRTC